MKNSIIREIWEIRGKLDRAIMSKQVNNLLFVREELEELIQEGHHIRTETACRQNNYSMNSGVNIFDKNDNFKLFLFHIDKLIERYCNQSFGDVKFVGYEDCILHKIWMLRARFDLVVIEMKGEDPDLIECLAQLKRIDESLLEILKESDMLNGFERDDVRYLINNIREFYAKNFKRISSNILV